MMVAHLSKCNSHVLFVSFSNIVVLSRTAEKKVAVTKKSRQVPPAHADGPVDSPGTSAPLTPKRKCVRVIMCFTMGSSLTPRPPFFQKKANTESTCYHHCGRSIG